MLTLDCSYGLILLCHSVLLSVIHSVSEQETQERGNGRRPNMVGMGKGWPSRSGWFLVLIWMWMYEQFFTSRNTGGYTFFRHAVTHQGATLQWRYQIRHFTWYIFSHQRATVQWPWRSLHCLSALVWIILLISFKCMFVNIIKWHFWKLYRVGIKFAHCFTPSLVEVCKCKLIVPIRTQNVYLWSYKKLHAMNDMDVMLSNQSIGLIYVAPKIVNEPVLAQITE